MNKKRLKIFVRFYASRIKYNRMTLDEVPDEYRVAVAAFMKTDEYILM